MINHSPLPTIIREKEHQKKNKKINGDQESVAGLTWNCLLMRVDNSAGNGTSGMDKFGSVIDIMNMKVGSKFPNFLRIKTQLLNRLQCAKFEEGATHSQKDGVESNGGSFKDGAEAFMLFLRGAQLVLRSSVLTLFDLDEVNVKHSNSKLSYCNLRPPIKYSINRCDESITLQWR